MMSFRFVNREQKTANLAILRDLFAEHHDDQLARTALSNAIAQAEATMVVGQLDDMMKQTARLYYVGAGTVSVFLLGLVALEVHWGNPLFAIGNAVYGLSIWGQVYLQRKFFTVTKWLEGFTTDLPTLPRSLLTAH